LKVTIVEYLASAKQRLLTELAAVAFAILRERATQADGHWRAKLSLADDSTLEFSEYMHVAAGNRIEVVTYSYHWADAEDQLICRWDNTPHFPCLPGFPYHIHDGPGDQVRSGQPTDIFAVLDEIVRRLSLLPQES
jgi:hypothetical protein